MGPAEFSPSRRIGYWGSRRPGARPLYAGEYLVKVAGGEDADHLAGRLDEQVLGGGSAADRVEQRHALQVGAEHHVRLDGPRHRPGVDPWPALRWRRRD